MEKKEKYVLRSKANTLKPLVIIGKDGFTANILESIQQSIKKHELIKISVLKTYSGMPIRDLGDLIANTIQGELIFVIGRVITIYKKNEEINAYGIH